MLAFDNATVNVAETFRITTEIMETTNASSLSNDTLVDTDAFRKLGIAIGIFDIIVGFCGNLLTIFAILYNKKLHKPFYIFIANLCVIDFLTASTMMPFNVASYYQKNWPFGNDSITCSFMAFYYYCCGYTSIVCLLTITVNRFVGVVHPINYTDLFTRRRIVCTLVISWVFVPSVMAPFFFFTNNGYRWNPQQTLCVFNTKDFNTNEKAYMQFTRILFQLLPLIIMMILYTLIFKTSKQCRQAVNRISSKNTSTSEAGKERSQRLNLVLENSSSTLIKNSDIKQDLKILEDCTNALDQQAEGKCTGSIVNQESSQNESNMSPKEERIEQIKLIQCHSNQSKSLAKSDVDIDGNETHQRNKRCLEGLQSLSTSTQKLKHRLEKTKSLSAPCSPVIKGSHGVNSRIRSRTRTEGDGLSKTSARRVDSSNLGKRSVSQNMFNSWTSIFQSTRRLSKRDKIHSSAMKLEAKKRKLMDRRLLRISLMICSVFMILFLPSVVVNLLKISDPRVHMFASVITWFNSCVNPMIYCFMNSKMRHQYKMLLSKAWNATCPWMKCHETTYLMARQSKRTSMRQYQPNASAV